MRASRLVAVPPLDFRFSGEDLEVSSELCGQIDEQWLQEQLVRPSIHQGTLLSVQDVRDGLVTVCRCSYRQFVACQRDEVSGEGSVFGRSL
jgi:hypothetical protein